MAWLNLLLISDIGIDKLMNMCSMYEYMHASNVKEVELCLCKQHDAQGEQDQVEHYNTSGCQKVGRCIPKERIVGKR